MNPNSQKPLLSLDRLVTHRFRGFAAYENTVAGVNAALSFGALNLEFDIRVAKCGTPMIYHDEYALDENGETHLIRDVLAADFVSLGGIFARIPKAETLFKEIAQHKYTSAKLLIDIKDAGFETEIHALVCLNRLLGRVMYVSWVPEALYWMHEISPNTPLCLSHWCQNPNTKIRSKHQVFQAVKGNVPRPKAHAYIHGQRSGWYLDTALTGELQAIISKTGGWVCVPQDMVTKPLVDAYHEANIKVSTFSYIDWAHIKDHEARFKIDAYFIDNKDVFDALG